MAVLWGQVDLQMGLLHSRVLPSQTQQGKGVCLKRVKYPWTLPEPGGLDKESQAGDAHPGVGHSHRGAPTNRVLPCTRTATTHRITELMGVEGTRADHLIHY